LTKVYKLFGHTHSLPHNVITSFFFDVLLVEAFFDVDNVFAIDFDADIDFDFDLEFDAVIDIDIDEASSGRL
jgi:ABC-type microcin C transport system permease subunit YejB